MGDSPNKKNNPESQHFVPQCYLREFIDPKNKPFIWRFDKNGKNKKKLHPKSILKSKNIYTLNIESDQKNYTIEKSLSNIEGEYATIFRDKIKNKIPLSEYEHIMLCAFSATMLIRTLRHKENIESFIGKLIEMIEAMEKQRGVLPKESEKLKKSKEEYFKRSIIETLPEITNLLFQMRVAFLFSQREPFITSDDPCNLFNPDLQWQKWLGYGLGQKHIQLTLALSPKIMLCLTWSELRGYIKISRNKASDLNRLTRAQCHRYFISSKPKTKLIWFSRYPFDLFFMIRKMRHIIGQIFREYG